MVLVIYCPHLQMLNLYASLSNFCWSCIVEEVVMIGIWGWMHKKIHKKDSKFK